MRTRTALAAALVVLGTAGAGVGAVVALRAGAALPGTTVAGIDVAGLTRAQVEQRLAGLAAERTTGTLALVDGDRTIPVERAGLGVQVDLAATAARTLAAGRSGGVLAPVLGPLLGRGEPVELVVTVDDDVLRARIDQIAGRVDAPAFGGDVVVTGLEVEAVLPTPGRTLDRAQAAADVERALAGGRSTPLPLPVEIDDPDTTRADVEQVAAQARQALAAPYRLTSPQATLELAPEELAPLVQAQFLDGELSLGLREPQFGALVTAKADALDRAPTPASFAVAGAPPTVDTQGDLTWTPQPAQVSVTPSAPGLEVDAAQAVARLRAQVGQTKREAELPVAEAPPSLATEQAQQAGVSSLLGTFTTYFPPGRPRVANIRRIASVLDGSYVAPGGQLSLNGIAGPRTRAKGYVADGAIIDGELVDVVGGGVSQFATTLFNAAFFAGLPIEQHRPHSFYISRYPAGRESTVNFGSIDVKIRNDTASGLVVKTASTGRSVTVSLYGDNGGRTVTSTSGPREPRDGGGFRISVTRTISGGDGRGGTRVFRTSYNPPPD